MVGRLQNNLVVLQPFDATLNWEDLAKKKLYCIWLGEGLTEVNSEGNIPGCNLLNARLIFHDAVNSDQRFGCLTKTYFYLGVYVKMNVLIVNNRLCNHEYIY